MEIISCKKEDLSQYGKSSTCEVFSVHVRVKNISLKAKEMILTISDRSWISKLGVVEQAAYTARANKTIEKIVEQILEKVENKVTEEFGEYLVTESARNALGKQYRHQIIPIAELWKEKITGNPGFDFHTVNSADIIAFGESKYSSSINPHTIAIKQIVSFINAQKDIMELADLQNFASQDAVKNVLNNNKAYVAAFSINGRNYDQIFKTSLKSESINPLLQYPFLYLIGIEICN